MDDINFDSIPLELKELPNWVLWVLWTNETRNDKPTKIPLNPKTGSNARSDDPSTWGTFDGAVQKYLECENGGIEGIGSMLSDGFIGIDLDKFEILKPGRSSPGPLRSLVS